MKTIYIILRHRRHLFGIRTEPVEAHLCLEMANLRRDYHLMKSKRGLRYTIAITDLK
jgi:hypothetical protein